MTSSTRPPIRESTTFHVAVSILIAVVTVASALVAWRASDAARRATAADSAANTELKRKQLTASQVDRDAAKHYEAFIRWSRNARLGELTSADRNDLYLRLDKAALDRLSQRVDEYFDLAQENLQFVRDQLPYFNPRTNAYDVRRERAEAFADVQAKQNVDPAQYKRDADDLRTLSRLIAVLITALACSLLALTIAYGASPAYRVAIAASGGAGLAVCLGALFLLETSSHG